MSRYISCCLFFVLWIISLLMSCSQINAVQVKQKLEPKPKPKPLNLNVEGLPDLKDVLAELNLMSFYDRFIRAGMVETRLLLRLGPTDFSIMSWDWEMPQEDINRLKDHINMLIIKATIPEQDESKDKALKERKKLVYGRIYMIDGVQSFEYSLASFGSPPPIGRMQLAMSDGVGNEDGCAPAKKDLSGKVLIVRRGSCTFLHKAVHALAANATAIIAVNTVDELESPSSGLGVDKTITNDMVNPINEKLSVVAVSNTSWAKFKYAIDMTATHGSSPVYIHIVPLQCGKKCIPILEEEQLLPSEIYSGSMRLKTHQGEVRSFEFVTSTFGGRLPKQPFRIVQAAVLDACTPFSESMRAKLISMEKSLPAKSTIAMIVTRGNCQFDIKAMHVQEAGGSLMIVVDPLDGPLQRLGGSQPESGYVGIPSIMTSLPAGIVMDKSFTLSARTKDEDSGHAGKGAELGDILTVGELTLSPDATQFDKWIEVAETTWAEDGERQLMQIDSLAQKYAAAKSPEIVLWLQRRADRIRGSKHKSIATDEF